MAYFRLLLLSLVLALNCASAASADEGVASRPASSNIATSVSAQQLTSAPTDLSVARDVTDSPQPVAAPIVDLVVPPALANIPVANVPSQPGTTAPYALQTAQVDDLWERIRLGFGMDELDNKLISRHEQWYARHPLYVARMVERSRRYLYYITQEVERRGMPSEIALLPIIESAFNPGANSSQQASGIWQFIPATAKKYGMERNWWYDGRRDIISATNGALDYLQQLHDQFGDWELALAAYNWGEGAVGRAIARNRKLHKPTSFAYLRLPPETRNYVPKLLAVKHIVSDPGRYGLTLAKIPDQPYFAAVTADHPIDVKLVAQFADISMDEFLALNPGHNRPVILDDESNVLLLPEDKLETFQTNLKNYTQRLVSWQPYTTQKGEHFDLLAQRFGMTPAELRRVNGLSVYAKVCSGQTILVPINADQQATPEFHAFNTDLVSIDDSFGKTLIHRVARGECISAIAHHYHITVARLESLNKGVKNLRVGQQLIVMQGKPGQPVKHYSKLRTHHPVRIASNKHKPRKADNKVAFNR